MIETVLQTIHNITDFKVVYICPDHNEKYHKRKVYMETFLRNLGFKDIVHFKSGNESYPKCLAVATQEILLKYIDVPFLLIEDDVGFIDKTEFTIPLDADAIYFGLSSCASHPTENYNIYYAEFEQFSSDQVKVKNMLGTHAIMYLTRKYKEKVIHTMQTCIDQGGYNDMAISRIQKHFNVYANKMPTFYQSNTFNTVINGFDVEKVTKVKITDDLSIKPIEGIRKMKLTDLKVVYICPDHNEKYNKRKLHMDTMLRKIGFKDIVHCKSGTEAYPSCLAKAVKTVLTTYLTEPVLLVEDDVEYIETSEFDYVEEADAIYFGLSWRGGHPTQDIYEGVAKFDHYSSSQKRVLNMLSTHAILYISKRYKETVIQLMDYCIEKRFNTDVVMSRIQKDFLVLANTIPSFYQSLNFNEEQWKYYEKNLENVQSSTKIRITDKLTTEQI